MSGGCEIADHDAHHQVLAFVMTGGWFETRALYSTNETAVNCLNETLTDKLIAHTLKLNQLLIHF